MAALIFIGGCREGQGEQEMGRRVQGKVRDFTLEDSIVKPLHILACALNLYARINQIFVADVFQRWLRESLI